jgi:UDP-N-acetylmuramoyl-L-alanyl-D-glutamate--2,6-diaminopimelate ligase
MPMFTEIITKLKELNITDISDNSQYVNKTTAFFCNEKAREKGFDLAAINNGCKAILYIANKKNAIENGVLKINFESWSEYTLFLQEFFETSKVIKVGITGTNGKTSTAHFGAVIYSLIDGKSATIGTNGICIYENGKVISTVETGLTTPTCTTFHSTLARLQKSGIRCVWVEASSIGIHQGRIDGILFDATCFTNLTQDHLDYHPTMEEYFQQKLRLFTEFLKPSGTAILNSQSDYSQKIAKEITKIFHRNITYYGSETFTENPSGFTINIDGNQINFPVYGRFQVQNLMCAFHALLSIGVEAKAIIPSISKLQAPSGRMESFQVNGVNIIIDFAHTPDALANVLQSISGYKIVVFGCGGNRDATKRPLMGEIASRLADFTIITNDNPRHEDPQTITSQVQSGFNGTHCRIILDRTTAIQEAIKLCQQDGSIIIAGKGSEPYQIIGETKIPYSDIDVVRKMLV